MLWMRRTPSHLVTERVAAPQHAHVRSRPTPRSLSLAQMAETVLSMGLVPALCHSRMLTTGHGNMPLRSGNETAHTGHPVNLTKGLFLARWTLSQAGTLGCVSQEKEQSNCTHRRPASLNQEKDCAQEHGGVWVGTFCALSWARRRTSSTTCWMPLAATCNRLRLHAGSN